MSLLCLGFSRPRPYDSIPLCRAPPSVQCTLTRWHPPLFPVSTGSDPPLPGLFVPHKVSLATPRLSQCLCPQDHVWLEKLERERSGGQQQPHCGPLTLLGLQLCPYSSTIRHVSSSKSWKKSSLSTAVPSSSSTRVSIPLSSRASSACPATGSRREGAELSHAPRSPATLRLLVGPRCWLIPQLCFLENCHPFKWLQRSEFFSCWGTLTKG